MNKEELLDLANYLDTGKTATPLVMKCFPHCALGQSVRRHHPELGTVDVAIKASQEEHNRYGVDRNSDDYSFMFGSHWPNCPHLAAERIRYVAIHGAAPSRDQWDRFSKRQSFVPAYISESTLNTESVELVYA